MKSTLLIAATSIIGATAATADINVRFIEGAPKDTFRIENAAEACLTGPMSIEVDLTGSAGKLIFDVTGSGAGVEVFQPFELVTGGERVIGSSEVQDGDKTLRLDLSALHGGAVVAFTIDVDDTLGAREITVSQSEIVGAAVTVTASGQSTTGTFNETAVAAVSGLNCPA